MKLFITHLSEVLTKEMGNDWRSNTIFLLDGASYHRSNEIRKFMREYCIDTVISAPYSYQAAPAELFFAHLKTNNFNEANVDTKKR